VGVGHASPERTAAAGEVLDRRVIPVDPDGWWFILVPLAVAGLVASLGWTKTALLPLALAAFMGYFFRDPERVPPRVTGAVVSPADGRVVELRDDLEDAFVGRARQVSIFLSPLDVHVNRSAIDGRVVTVEHRPGAFVPAYRLDASARNEQTSLELAGEGARVVMRQIAGVLARRIVCRVRPGDTLRAGQRFGMIRFGSRMDVVMPTAAQLRVRVGDRVRAGETILGVLE
jgi:phosphatidylserine decarboxylase